MKLLLALLLLAIAIHEWVLYLRSNRQREAYQTMRRNRECLAMGQSWLFNYGRRVAVVIERVEDDEVTYTLSATGSIYTSSVSWFEQHYTPERYATLNTRSHEKTYSEAMD